MSTRHINPQGLHRHAGDFDSQSPPGWLLATTISLSHAAAEEVAAGRMSSSDASKCLRESVLRVFGVGG